MSDLISRQAVMKEFSDFVRRANNSDFAKTPTWNDAVSLVGSLPSAEVTLCHLDSPCEYQNADIATPSAQPDIIHCCDCIYYDPEHIENNGVRYEYKDMPKAAFDVLGIGLVTAEYGINVGGRCCRDYNVGYSEDKRVFVSEQNYCGRARRRQDE